MPPARPISKKESLVQCSWQPTGPPTEMYVRPGGGENSQAPEGVIKESLIAIKLIEVTLITKH